jgi:hypothetical protein
MFQMKNSKSSVISVLISLVFGIFFMSAVAFADDDGNTGTTDTIAFKINVPNAENTGFVPLMVEESIETIYKNYKDAV